jgi:hypothetical protein
MDGWTDGMEAGYRSNISATMVIDEPNGTLSIVPFLFTLPGTGKHHLGTRVCRQIGVEVEVKSTGLNVGIEQ